MDQIIPHDKYNFSKHELEAKQELLRLMADVPSIKFQTDDRFLSKYLRFSNWDAGKALDHIKRVYQVRRKHPDWFSMKRASEYIDLMRTNQRFILEDRDKNGRRIFVYKLGNTPPTTKIQEAAQLDDMYYESMLTEYETQINGMTVIIDCKDIPLHCLKWCHPKYVRVGSEKSDLLPLENLTAHIVNTSKLLNVVVQAVTPFLSKQMKDKFIFHQSNWPSLHEYVGADCLPEEYGGPVGKVINYEKSYQYLIDREEVMFSNRQYGIIN